MSTIPRNDAGWLSRPDCARVFDLSLPMFDKAVRPLALPEHIRREGRTLFLYARGLIDSWAAKHATSPEIISSRARFEAARAGMAELRLGRERGLLVTRQEFQVALSERATWYVAHLEAGAARLPSQLQGRSLPEMQEILNRWTVEVRLETYGTPAATPPPAPDG
jgi:hypothetical protein